MSDVDIVIVNYRSLDHTPSCVRAAHATAASDQVSISIFVINNEDDPDTLAKEVTAAGGADIIEPDHNLGFAAACNLGSQKGRARAVLFLNPDASLTPGALRALLGALSETELAAPALTTADGTLTASCSRLPTAFDLLNRSLGLHRLRKNNGYPYLPLSDHAASGPVDQAMGAALMIRRDAFEALGGFDERFFVYYEDVDICARAKADHMTLQYVREADVTHIGQGSSSKDRPAATALHARSRLTYAGKHFGGVWQCIIAIAIVGVEMPLRLLEALFGRIPSSPGGVLRSFVLLFRNPRHSS